MNTYYSSKIIQKNRFPNISLLEIDNKFCGYSKEYAPPDLILMQQEADGILCKCIKKLSAEEQNILISYYYKNVSDDTYAKQNNFCRATAFNQRGVALAKLKKELLKHEDFQSE